MKIIRTEQIVTEKKLVSKYQSLDGKIFDTFSECKNYEHELIKNDLGKIKCCKEAENYPGFDGGEHYDSSNYSWYYPTSYDDIITLNNIYDFDLSLSDVNKWIGIEYAGNRDGWYCTLDSCINYARELLNILGYDMIVTKREK